QETVYCLHIKSLPAIHENTEHNLHIVVKSSFKLFYGPESLNSSAESAFKEVTFSYNNQKVTATNPTGHYITLREL
ncbi:molecular chaperone, partial [Proteus mirabilis]|uniref:fimbrial biogenesis chaperone n=1 Tax=Proteus mirabilis TaxID=584 RepID=UPI0034E5F596